MVEERVPVRHFQGRRKALVTSRALHRERHSFQMSRLARSPHAAPTCGPSLQHSIRLPGG